MFIAACILLGISLLANGILYKLWTEEAELNDAESQIDLLRDRVLKLSSRMSVLSTSSTQAHKILLRIHDNYHYEGNTDQYGSLMFHINNYKKDAVKNRGKFES